MNRGDNFEAFGRKRKTDIGEQVSAEQVQKTIIHLRNLDSFKKAEVAEILMPNEVVIKGNIPNFLARQFN